MISLTPKNRIKGSFSRLAAGSLAAGIVAIFAGGCSQSRERQYGTLEPTAEPLVVNDEAMDTRHWSQSVALYPSGWTEAFPVRWPFPGYETHTDLLPVNAVVEPVLFGAELITMPPRLVTEPAGKMALYAGPVVPPTYNGMPPLPPAPVPPAPPAAHRPFRPITRFRAWVRATWRDSFGSRTEEKAGAEGPSTERVSAPVSTTASSTEPSPAGPALTQPGVTQPSTTPGGQ